MGQMGRYRDGPAQKASHAGFAKIELVPPEKFTLGKMSLADVLRKRRSRRKFIEASLSLEELSFLLWAAQGVSGEKSFFRTYPSGGARHPFECYISIKNVDGIKPGLYRYYPPEHILVLLFEDGSLNEKIAEACNKQAFVGEGSVIFIWSAVPYRTEWRYDVLSHKIIAIDAGHLCQNLYLAAEAIGCGTCGIGAYNQERMDKIIGADGADEFTIYVAPVGKI